MLKRFFIIRVLFFSVFAVNAQIDSTAITSYWQELKASPELLRSFNKLERIKNKSQERYTIVHFGDSHVQGDAFSSAIRNAFQTNFGAAGQGIIFPYSLSRSYGPKGIVATTNGNWTGTNIMDGAHKSHIGISGYTLYTSKDSATLNFEITDKFKGHYSNRIAIWTSAGEHSLDYEVAQLKLVEAHLIAPDLKLCIFESDAPIQSFAITTIKKTEAANVFYFHGFEFLFDDKAGVNYYRCGVVGAQFTHLIANAKLVFSQLKALQPDLVIFSFGSNESYAQNIVGASYFKAIADFLTEIKNTIPQAAILITTAPDTRSQGRTPPSQIVVNNELVNLANHFNFALYDLYKAMGGWGSMHRWHAQKLALDDKLHFNARGYGLLAKLLCGAIFHAYNNACPNSSLPGFDLAEEFKGLQSSISNSPVLTAEQATDVAVAEKKIPKNKTKKKSKETVYVVKSGDMVSKIALKFKVSAQKILKANRLQENTIIRPGQKLKIPKH